MRLWRRGAPTAGKESTQWWENKLREIVGEQTRLVLVVLEGLAKRQHEILAQRSSMETLVRLRELTEQLERQERRDMVLDYIANSITGVVVADQDGRIKLANVTAQRMFGMNFAELTGDRKIEVLLPERYRESYRQELERIKAGGKSRLVEKIVKTEGLRSTGQEFEMALLLEVSTDRRALTAVMLDLSSAETL